MTPELSQRIAAAFANGDATLTERSTLINAVASRTVTTMDDLPYDARELLRVLEERGSQAGDVIAGAGESHTGAMIALIPTEKDAARLAVDGGEDADELHVTLGYLGEAALLPEELKHALVDCVARCVADRPTVVGSAFAVATFNPVTDVTASTLGFDDIPQLNDVIAAAAGGEPCVVMLVSGQQVAIVQRDVMNDVTGTFAQLGVQMHPQHDPWVAHLTLVYTTDADLSYFADLVGPVTFDRVRLAFGDDVYDVPLGDTGTEVIAGGDDSVEESADYVAGTTAQRERNVNAPGDGHNLRDYWVRGEGAARIRWGTDGSFARCVALLGEHVKNPQGLCAEYHKAATGEWPAEKGVESVSEVETLADKTPHGDVTYADPGYQEDGVKRYPLDTEEHVRAAWSYINVADNADMYSATDLKRVRGRIERAMRRLDAELAEDDDATTAAGELGDCPPGHHLMPTGECMADDEMTDEYALVGDAPWNGVLTVEGVESGDGRMFAGGSLTWDEPPLPLMWQKETTHGGTNDVSVRVGSIERIWREPDPAGRTDVFFVRGEGKIDLENPDGAEVFRRMRKKQLRGNSVDVDSVKDTNVELTYPEVDAESGGGVQAIFAAPELTTYHKGRIRATTLVEIPAFTEARLELTDAVTASGNDGNDGDEIECATCAAELAEVDVTGMPESIARALSELTAATSVIEIGDAPPREWFDEPTDVAALGALTVTAEGRIYGYVAPAGVRHRSFQNRSVYVPLRNVDYERFHGGETIVADGGRVSTGAITMDCGHATTAVRLTGSQAQEHYENSCSLVATARVGENERGVWMAGALLPDVSAAQVRRIMACRLSGDWRTHLDRPGWREFVAALLVPVPGFPLGRSAPSVEIAEGQLVAASVPVRLEGLSNDGNRAARLAAVRARVATSQRDTRIAALVARVRPE